MSLERLATAHDEYLKRTTPSSEKAEEFLTSKQRDAIRDVLGAVVTALAPHLGLPSETTRILVDKKINNIHTPPNADKLKEEFTFLGIELTSEERKAIDNRNKTLHGRRTMKDTTIAAIAEENRRFDVLRTLINKAILRLLRYEGLYMDYGSPSPPKGFSIGSIGKEPAVKIEPSL